MKRTTLSLALFVCWSHESAGQPANPANTLPMEQAIALALEHHPVLKASTHLTQAAEYWVDQVNSAYYPQLYFNTSLTRWDWVLPNKKIYLGNSLNDLYAEFTVQQLLYNGGRTSIQSDLARNLVDVESINNQRLQQGIVFSVARAYLLLLKAERIVAVQELTIANLRDHVATAELLYRSGKVSQLDVLKARTQLALANEELVKAKNSVTTRRQELFGAMGIDTVYDFRTLDRTEALWQREQFRSLREDSLLALLNRHPDLQRAELDIQGHEQEISLAQTDYYPSVFVRGSYNWEDSRVFPGNKNWNVGVGLSLPLFQGGATQASVDQAKSRTEAVRATEEALRQRLQVAVRTTLTTLDDTRSRVRSAAEIVRLAEESEKVASLKYRTGKGTNLDVLDAEVILTNARINYIQVLTDYAVAVAELNFNLGSAGVPFHE
jgi:outer membrane protein TolC